MNFIKQSFLFLAFSLMTIGLSAQSVLGIWKSIDDETGKAKSHIEVFEKDGKVYGKVVKILNEARKDALCDDCPGDKKGKPVQGMEILWDLKKDGSTYSGGKIMDPKNGKVYKCYIELAEDGQLKVRGYIGFAALGRTQYWQRVN